MTPECRCGSFVSADYARVFAPEGRDGEEGEVRACPNCNVIRERGSIREARSRGGYEREVALE